MAWRSRVLPYFREDRVRPRTRDTVPMGQCPPDLSAQLAINGLLPDEATARDGNCGIDAFARSLMHQWEQGCQTHLVKRRQTLQTTSDKVSFLRRVGVAWLEAHAREFLWDGMTVASLCEIVSGTNFHGYLAKMRQNSEWIDTAFLHALGCEYGANVVIFQPHMEPALVGMCMTERVGEESDVPIMVPIALLNDTHFWGVLAGTPPPHIDPIDKGELPVFRSSMGLCPSSGTQARPGTAEEADEDGEEPDMEFQDAHRPPDVSPGDLDVEIQLCQALSRWDPWSVPSAEVLQAMQDVQRQRASSSGMMQSDTAQVCAQRAEAITALAYEETYSQALPDSLRYQRLARIWLSNPTTWHRRAKDRSVTSRYLSVCAGIKSVDSLTRKLVDAVCAQHQKPHAPGNQGCIGMASFTATMVYNWRVLWWSLPWVSRKEWMLRFFGGSLKASRAAGFPDERWRVQFSFLGQHVCRHAFSSLTGIGISVLHDARKSALDNKVSWSPSSERGFHGGAIKNHWKPAAYLGARQWLEWYAETHAEWSPMESKAYLPAGRKVFYYYQYRKDILERHGVTEDDVMQEKARHPQKRTRRGDLTNAGAYAPASAPGSEPTNAGAYAPASAVGSEPTDVGAYVPASAPGSQSTDARAYTLASRRMEDVPLADVTTFVRAWRLECPWLVVCKSVSMFTRCSVCEYLRLLIDQTPRDQEPLRNALKSRLGGHFEFQAAQRLAHGRIEEECEQSGGQKWFMLIDKMDQQKDRVPNDLEPVVHQAVPGSGEKIGLRLDRIHVVWKQTHDASRAYSIQ